MPAGNKKGAGGVPLPPGYLARNVPSDYDGSTPCPNPDHESFCVNVAAGMMLVTSYSAVRPNTGSPGASGSKWAKLPHIHRRTNWLREEKVRNRVIVQTFDGFISAVEDAMSSVAKLVEMCERAGLPR